MRKPKRFNLLFVHGDGTQVLRLNVSRWVLYSGVLVLILAGSVLGAISGHYLSLKWQGGQMAGLQRQVAEQRALMDTFHHRVADIRSEVTGWRELHARIWEAFGPEESGARKGTGIGGGTETGPAPAPGDRAALSRELDLMAANVSEVGQSLQALERVISKAGKLLAALPSRWPVRGSVNSEFGDRLSPWSGAKEFHSGIDISAGRGTPVRAPAQGVVALAGTQSEYGLTMILDHGHDIKTLYGHLQKILVAPGQRVERGQIIAFTGNTGKSSGPHLHYEITVKNQSVNPRRYLWD